MHKKATDQRLQAHRAVRPISYSADWYCKATHYPLQLPHTVKKETGINLHHLRLGYRCMTEIKTRNEMTCEHCQETTREPLLHYLLKCPVTTDLRHLTGTRQDIDPLDEEAIIAAIEIIREATDSHTEILIQIIESHPPQR
ncbi:hypothetical protein Pcinc_003185 [Petrolisthes cinctipes]|uniref:Uncharacterized protein n=1 Tax=Petrolisthes cinctipes TaxID=88211 RepID=A0AAE1GJI6_PETCI|nr:hypothetical protein Pcinc_003185 [Petrolisthes cinctipes]